MDAAFRAGHNRYDFVLPRKDGSRLPVIISSRTFQNSGSQFGMLIFTDISEQVRAEQELHSANEKLQKRRMEIEGDLRLAARVQHSLAPRSLVLDTMSVDTFYSPVHSVGGDFALVNSLDHEHLSLLVCDVSGHGIGSAFLGRESNSDSETSAHLRNGMPFDEMFGELNRFLIEEIGSSGLFVTLAAARIDVSRRRMVFAGAGHPPAMLARRGQNHPVARISRRYKFSAHCLRLWKRRTVWSCNSNRTKIQSSYTPTGLLRSLILSGEMLGVSGLQENSSVHCLCCLQRK